MRYIINPRFTYLFTYLFTSRHQSLRWFTFGTDVQIAEAQVEGNIQLYDDVSGRLKVGRIASDTDRSTCCHVIRILTTHDVMSQNWRRHQSRNVRQTDCDVFRLLACKTIARTNDIGSERPLLQQIFQSVVISKLTYAAPAWWGFSTSADRQLIETFLRRAARSGLLESAMTAEELVNDADERLF